MIGGIFHTNIRLRDIDKCLPFYRDVLGLKVSSDSGAERSAGGNINERRAVYLRWDLGPKQSFVVLQSFQSAESEAPPKAHLENLLAMGINHFGFWVDDLDAIVTRAAQAGVKTVRETSVICIGRDYGYPDVGSEPCVETVQLIDPENNVIQLDRWIGK